MILRETLRLSVYGECRRQEGALVQQPHSAGAFHRGLLTSSLNYREMAFQPLDVLQSDFEIYIPRSHTSSSCVTMLVDKTSLVY